MPIAACREHVVDFYGLEDRLFQRVSAYLAAGLRSGDAGVVIAIEAHRQGIESELAVLGIDLRAAAAEGRWVVLDAASTLASLAPDAPEERSPEDVIAPVLRSAGAGGRRVRVYGEMVQLLWEMGDVNAAVNLESQWNEVGNHLDFALYCAYQAVEDEAAREAVETICKLHTDVAHCHGWPGYRQMEAAFQPEPSSPRDARRFMREVLEQWGLAGTGDAAELVLTELTTNALLHARSDFRVVLNEGGPVLHIAVHDHNRDLPRRYSTELESFSGRGLALIEAMSVQWGCAVRSDGKEVWADVPLSVDLN